MQTLDELVGEFVELEQSRRLEEFGRPKSSGLPVPEAVRTELSQRLQSLLLTIKAFNSNAAPVRKDFLAAYTELADAQQYVSAVAAQFSPGDDGMFRYYLTIPEKILAVMKPKAAQQTKTFTEELNALFHTLDRKTIPDVPAVLIRHARDDITALLSEYVSLKRIGQLVWATVYLPEIEKYIREHGKMEHVHRTHFLPMVAAYCENQLGDKSDLLLIHRRVVALIPKYVRRGISKLFRKFDFPEYAEEAQRFAKELSVHYTHYDEIANLRERLSRGRILSSACSPEFRNLRYLAPILAEAVKRESAAVRQEPQPILPRTPIHFPSLPMPPETVHPQLRAAYAYLTYPIGWVGRLEKFLDSLAGIPMEKRTTADLQYCAALRAYLKAVGVTPPFVTFLSQFPVLEQNYAGGMARLEQLCIA